MTEQMKAVQYREVGAAPEVVEIPKPAPGPGQVLLQVTAAGLCHSDMFVMGLRSEELMFPLPLTLGHEGVGTVAELGAGVATVGVGDEVAVYGPWGCGRCAKCAVGKENYCLRAGELGIFPPGLGAPGAIAEYLIVDSDRHLIPLGGLDPVDAAPLTDAGLTPYHAIKAVLPTLVPGSTAVVIGAGGLGHIAIQLLRALTAARVIALDVSDAKLALAREVGAHEALLSDDDAPEQVRRSTGGKGAAAVFDFVGAETTVAIAGKCVGVEGRVMIVGIGGGSLPVGFGSLAYDAAVAAPYWGSRSELLEVFELARAGHIAVHTETYPIDDAPTAYEHLRQGKVRGRAVILPQA